ncbi:hypothetical protein ACFX1T_034809 [Malus domestica]
MCHYDFVSDDGVDEAIINLGTGGQVFSLQLGVVHQYFYLKSIKEVHDDNNLVLEFKIGRTRKQTMTSILTEVLESFAKFQFHNPVWLDFIHASNNKRLSERIDLLKVLNMDAFCSYHDDIVRFQGMANLYIFYARNLFVAGISVGDDFLANEHTAPLGDLAPVEGCCRPSAFSSGFVGQVSSGKTLRVRLKEKDSVNFERCLCGALGVGLKARNQG